MPGSPMRPLRAAVLVPAILVLALAALAGLFELAAPAAAADRGDRLDRFRELAASRLGLAQIVDTFAEGWGGASLRLVRTSGVLVGAFMLDERSPANSVRVYGTRRGERALLSALYREGRPSVHGGGADGTPLVITWEGTISGW